MESPGLSARVAVDGPEALPDALAEIVWTAGAGGTILWSNQRWHEFAGGQAWERLLHPDDLVRWRETWNRALSSGEPFELEHRLWDRRNTHYRWFLTRARSICAAGGSITGWAGISIDIDRYKQTLDELRQANEDLQQFAYSASHDLREPLRMVAVYSQLLQRKLGDLADPEIKEYLDITLQGADRMEALVRDLLAYTRAAAIEVETSQTANAKLALDIALANLQSGIDEHGVLVSAENLPVVHVQLTHLVELFQQLISNSIRYRGTEPPTITIRAERRDSDWIFSVADNGIGIAPRYHEYIFGVFKRLHGRSHSSGTGIGLAICRKIVERYGGRIWVSSEEGRGATFYFTLPAEESAGQPPVSS